ncbi:IS3 family transposase [Streptococcus danieliae]
MSLDYIHWWNHQRIHGSLNYQPPMGGWDKNPSD